MDNENKFKPKSHFINITNRAELSLWDRAINQLKSEELITFKNGFGYFCLTDYQTAINIINN